MEAKAADIIIYTTKGCPFCKRAKQFLLKKKKIAFREIDLSQQNPLCYSKVLSFLQSCNEGTYQIPQIFINGKHIGGCVDLIKLDRKGNLDGIIFEAPPHDYDPALVCCASDLAISTVDPSQCTEKPLYSAYLDAPKASDSEPSLHAAPLEPSEESKKRKEPEEAQVEQQQAKKRKEDSGERDIALQAVLKVSEWLCARMRSALPLWKKLVGGRSSYAHSELVNCLEKEKEAWISSLPSLAALFPRDPSQSEAQYLLHVLLQCSALRRSDKKEAQEDLSNASFYFYAEKHRGVLNLGVKVSQENPLFQAELGKKRSVNELSEEMRTVLTHIYDDAIDDEGRVHYAHIASHPSFPRYKSLSCLLQTLCIDELTRNEKIAFFVNIYNVLVIDGISSALSARPERPFSLSAEKNFFRDTAYKIGSYVLSLDDIEHGILRGNRGHPGLVGKILGYHFAESDPKASLALRCKEVNPFIHFALVCGAKSCPPVHVYSPQNIDQLLNVSASNFVEGTTTVEGSHVTLSKLFCWYFGDFGENIEQVLSTVSLLVSKQKRSQILQLLSQSKYSYSFSPYDWSLNSD